LQVTKASRMIQPTWPGARKPVWSTLYPPTSALTVLHRYTLPPNRPSKMFAHSLLSPVRRCSSLLRSPEAAQSTLLRLDVHRPPPTPNRGKCTNNTSTSYPTFTSYQHKVQEPAATAYHQTPPSFTPQACQPFSKKGDFRRIPRSLWRQDPCSHSPPPLAEQLTDETFFAIRAPKLLYAPLVALLWAKCLKCLHPPYSLESDSNGFKIVLDLVSVILFSLGLLPFRGHKPEELNALPWHPPPPTTHERLGVLLHFKHTICRASLALSIEPPLAYIQ
jgi:hypothetical protein